MRIKINGRWKEFPEPVHLDKLIEELELENGSLAVAVNRKVIPKTRYQATPLENGDEVEIIHAVAGG